MKNEILSRQDILAIGKNLDDDDIDFEGDNDYEPFAYTVHYDENGNKSMFTGLIYDVNPDSGVINSYTFVKDGLKEGHDVEFYPNGRVKSVTQMKKGVAWGDCYEFYDTGNTKEVAHIIAGFTMTFTKYDNQGNIIEEKTEPTDFDKRMAKKFGGVTL